MDLKWDWMAFSSSSIKDQPYLPFRSVKSFMEAESHGIAQGGCWSAAGSGSGRDFVMVVTAR
jgi:hypothetical protein